jgi:hypothetical protein
MSMAPRNTNSRMVSPGSTTMFSNSDVIDFRAGVMLDNSAIEGAPNLPSALATAHIDASNHIDQAAILAAVQVAMSNRAAPCQIQSEKNDTSHEGVLEAVRICMENIEAAKSKVSHNTADTRDANPMTTPPSREHVRDIVKSVMQQHANHADNAASKVSATGSASDSYKDMLLRRARREGLANDNHTFANRPPTTRIASESVENAVRAALGKYMSTDQGTRVSRNEKMSSVLY